MYQRKTPKSQKPDRTPYTAYNPHNISLTERKWEDTIRIISIDPGIRNYALRVESDIKITATFGRLDTSSERLAFYTSAYYCY